jgi:chorismate dehydratase
VDGALTFVWVALVPFYHLVITGPLKSLRVGCVKYLNARPLIRGWASDVDLDHPSALCERLANGDLDVALVSSFEFLRNPIYRIIDDISISSAGPVYSVIVAHRGNIPEIDEIEIDAASKTSGNLLLCLLGELNLSVRLVDPTQSPITTRRARLFIGDQAIRFRQTHSDEFRFWDLGEQWQKFVGLPFVYALWLIRPEIVDSKSIANNLRALRDENIAHLDALITAEEFDPEFCARYYRGHLRFSFGEREKEGLRIFANLCAKYRLLPKRDLAFSFV